MHLSHKKTNIIQSDSYFIIMVIIVFMILGLALVPFHGVKLRTISALAFVWLLCS